MFDIFHKRIATLAIVLLLAIRASPQTGQGLPQISKKDVYTRYFPSVPTGEKMIVRARYNMIDPLKIQGFLVDGKDVASAAPFPDPTDWLRKTVVLVHNDSAKTAVSLVFQIDFIEYPGIAAECFIGKMPDVDRFGQGGRPFPQDPSLTDLEIRGNATVPIPLSQCYGKFDPELKQTADNAKTVSIAQVEVKLNYFEDGTRYANGMGYPKGYQKPTADHHWEDINQEEFGPLTISHF